MIYIAFNEKWSPTTMQAFDNAATGDKRGNVIRIDSKGCSIIAQPIVKAIIALLGSGATAVECLQVDNVIQRRKTRGKSRRVYNRNQIDIVNSFLRRTPLSRKILPILSVLAMQISKLKPLCLFPDLELFNRYCRILRLVQTATLLFCAKQYIR